MGYVVIRSLDSTVYNRVLIQLDTGEEDLPVIRDRSSIMPGSEAYVIATNKTWILSSKYEWLPKDDVKYEVFPAGNCCSGDCTTGGGSSTTVTPVHIDTDPTKGVIIETGRTITLSASGAAEVHKEYEYFSRDAKWVPFPNAVAAGGTYACPLISCSAGIPVISTASIMVADYSSIITQRLFYGPAEGAHLFSVGATKTIELAAADTYYYVGPDAAHHITFKFFAPENSVITVLA